MKLSKPVALIIGAAALVAGMTGCSVDDITALGNDEQTSAAPAPEFEAPEGSVADAIKNDIKTEDYNCNDKNAEEKYDRCDGSYSGNRVALYGDPWIDVDENGCDTRNDILQRDLEDVRVDESDCKVVAGVLDNPYSVDEQIVFEPGSLIQIDHIIPLAPFHYAGGKDMTQDERVIAANDPENLLASKGNPTKDENDEPVSIADNNNSKSDQLPDTWLPAADQWTEKAKDGQTPTAADLPDNTDLQCNYVADIAYVAVKYDLVLPEDSTEAMLTVLSTCPDQGF